MANEENGETINGRQYTLSFDQFRKINNAFTDLFEIHGRGNFPTLEVSLMSIVKQVRKKLAASSIAVTDVRLNGSFAAHILEDPSANPLAYNDIDIIFSVQLENEEALLRIKDLVIECLYEFLPDETNKNKLSIATLTDAYVSKLTKVWNKHGDKWSLITLSSQVGMYLELKFVDTMKRQFQFSVDSFQIILDSLMQFYDLTSEQKSLEMSNGFYPSIIAESMYGDFHEALNHLNNRLIATHSPQEIRGGGLLKYCHLLTGGYRHADDLSEVEMLERYMCSRFFIDYPDPSDQYQKLHAYLLNHFVDDYISMVPYLYELYRVVSESTVCLMGHERRQALHLIHQVKVDVEQELLRQDEILRQSYDNECPGENNNTSNSYFYLPYFAQQPVHMHIYSFPHVQHVC